MADNVTIQMVLPAPVEAVWAAFTDSQLRSQWEACEYHIDARTGGAYSWQIPGHGGEGVIETCDPPSLLVQYDASGTHGETRQIFRFAPVGEAETSLDLLHEGLGNADLVRSVTLGWQQALADLVVWLKHGVRANRFGRAMQHLGLYPLDLAEGLVISSLEDDGVAHLAGLRVGDLLLAVDGVPVFTRPELWTCMRRAQPGDRLVVEFVRDGDLASAELVFPPG